ncbi:MAG: protein-glutamate methylesterase/protein-glutamine glutaminase [Spirochaetota bacterium]
MIRVLIVDDSPLVRKIASDVLAADPGIQVVATASNAEIALRKVQQLSPDVVTMDIEMPGMGGLAAIREIMSRWPTPVIVMSAFATRGAELTMQALELGAVDFIPKPSSSLSGGISDISRELVEKVKNAYTVTVRRLETIEEQKSESERKAGQVRRFDVSSVLDYEIVAMGTSTGGPVALKTVLSRLPRDFPVGVVVVQHMPPVFTKAFAQRLDSLCAIDVAEATDGDLIRPGLALVAPGDYHMTVTRYNTRPKVLLHRWNPVSGHRPSVDVLMHSVAREYGPRAVGVIMTGMGKDGAEGLAELKKRGGRVIAQDRASSVIYGMNGEVVRSGTAHEVVSLIDIADRLMDHLQISRQVS